MKLQNFRLFVLIARDIMCNAFFDCLLFLMFNICNKFSENSYYSLCNVHQVEKLVERLN